MRAAIYAHVSTFDQEPENQLQELRRFVEARGWTATEYIDRGISGAKDRRPALDHLIGDVKRRRFDVVVCWRLDRLGRNLKHLITFLEELQAGRRPRRSPFLAARCAKRRGSGGCPSRPPRDGSRRASAVRFCQLHNPCPTEHRREGVAS
ncbi:MAG: hypothetical protein DMF89_13435 [Acidobacteria bacterium]|nr:MAG: hypothetical protein DMF89_13435 [Acidobacteriota bacterium]